MRFKLIELNLFRITNAVIRRLISIPHKLSWFMNSKSNSDKLKLYENKYKGQTCYLVANGPSLKKMDLSFLENKISFGLNRIYLAYDDMKFTNNFLVSINKLVLSQFSDDINSLKITKFLNWECRNHFDLNMENNLFVYKSFFGKKFGKKMNTSINPAATVTYAALQIIYYMGFQKVIIIGMDHNFITKDIYCNITLLLLNMMIIIYMTLTDNYTEYYDISKFLLNLYIYKYIISILILIKYKTTITHIKIIIGMCMLYIYYFTHNIIDCFYVYSLLFISINNNDIYYNCCYILTLCIYYKLKYYCL